MRKVHYYDIKGKDSILVFREKFDWKNGRQLPGEYDTSKTLILIDSSIRKIETLEFDSINSIKPSYRGITYYDNHWRKIKERMQYENMPEFEKTLSMNLISMDRYLQ